MATLYKKVADYENLHKCFMVLPKLNRCYMDEHVLKMFFKDKYSYQLCSLCFYHITYLLRVNPHSVKWLASWLSVYLWTKSLWVWVLLQYSIVPSCFWICLARSNISYRKIGEYENLHKHFKFLPKLKDLLSKQASLQDAWQRLPW